MNDAETETRSGYGSPLPVVSRAASSHLSTSCTPRGCCFCRAVAAILQLFELVRGSWLLKRESILSLIWLSTSTYLKTYLP
jgi:hypothetical protein